VHVDQDPQQSRAELEITDVRKTSFGGMKILVHIADNVSGDLKIARVFLRECSFHCIFEVMTGRATAN
jgi:hypothetical protein